MGPEHISSGIIPLSILELKSTTLRLLQNEIEAGNSPLILLSLSRSVSSEARFLRIESGKAPVKLFFDKSRTWSVE